MVPRATVIAVLIGIEVALLYGMAVAVGGGPSLPTPAFGGPPGAAGVTAFAPQSFATGAHPSLAIDVGMADVTIDTHPVARIDVSVSDARRHVGSTASITARSDGQTVHIVSDQTDFWSFMGDSRVIHISVPAATTVGIVNAGNVTVTGLRADATIVSGAHFRSEDGIRVRDFQGTLNASADGGTIDIADAECPDLHVTADNGRVTLTHVSARKIDATSSNGRVEGTDLQLRDGRVASANGRVSLRFASGADTTVTAAADNGHIDVSGFAATPAKYVKSGGDDEDDDDDDATSAQTVRVGAGSGRLDVHAGNGSIYLSQEG
ncbi:MAG: DUF4097 family beta strand repeat-containing protein [Candidatus Lustribacter sp.]|jgi:hypothetical protein